MHNFTAQRATRRVFVEKIPALASQINSRVVNPTDGLALAQLMHDAGINLRWMGQLHEKVEIDYVCGFLQTEMIARTVKVLLQGSWRMAVQGAVADGDDVQRSCRVAALQMFNKVFLLLAV